MTDWITPSEASLEVSIRKGFFVSPDDLKQLRKNKIGENYVKRLSKRVVLYDRNFIVEQLPAPHKRVMHPIEPEHIANWLEEHPQVIIALVTSGLRVPHLDQANEILAQRIKQRRKPEESA